MCSSLLSLCGHKPAIHDAFPDLTLAQFFQQFYKHLVLYTESIVSVLVKILRKTIQNISSSRESWHSGLICYLRSWCPIYIPVQVSSCSTSEPSRDNPSEKVPESIWAPAAHVSVSVKIPGSWFLPCPVLAYMWTSESKPTDGNSLPFFLLTLFLK